VPCIYVGSPYPGNHVERFVIRDADHEIHCPYRVTHSIQGLDEVLLPFRQEFGISLLDVSRVGEHYCAEVPRCGSRPDGFGVTLSDQIGKPARMIDVCMRENDGVEISDQERQSAVLLRGVLSLPLKHAAVERDGMSVDVQKMTGAGDFTRGTDEGYLQIAILPLRHHAERGS
jgi:hypothetical protein